MIDYKKIGLLVLTFCFTNTFSQHLNNSNVRILSDTSIFDPGTLNMCHASTIVETSAGTFIAAWFAGSYEGANDVGIWMSEFSKGKWDAPVKVINGVDSNGNPLPCWNPVLFKTKSKTLILFYKVGISPREWWGCAIRSKDYGKSWSQPEALPDGFLGPIKNKPIQLEAGDILCPSSTEGKNGNWSVHLEITDENLNSWKKIQIEADSGVGVIQPTILEHNDGRLQMLCRSRQNLIYQTWSNDGGQSWNKLYKTSLPNPNSGIDAVALDNGDFVLVYNPLLAGPKWFNGRNVLNVAVSYDGVDWKDILQLENEGEGEFSYPAVIKASDKTVHITYTARRKTIKHIILSFE